MASANFVSLLVLLLPSILCFVGNRNQVFFYLFFYMPQSRIKSIKFIFVSEIFLFTLIYTDIFSAWFLLLLLLISYFCSLLLFVHVELELWQKVISPLGDEYSNYDSKKKICRSRKEQVSSDLLNFVFWTLFSFFFLKKSGSKINIRGRGGLFPFWTMKGLSQ